MKFTKNEQGQMQAQFSSKLLSVGSNVLKNVNDTEYRIVGIKFEDAKGVEQEVTAIMYESNFKHGVEVGKNYLTTATQTDQGVFLQVSHLESIDKRATDDMFDFAHAIVSETVETKQD